MGLGILPPPGVAAPKAPLVQDFISSGTWVMPAGAREVTVECLGAGGSGAAAGKATGGQGGNYSRRTYAASDLPASVPVTVGAGGLAVTGAGVNGNTGGGSLFAPGGGQPTTVARGGRAGLYNGQSFELLAGFLEPSAGDGDFVSLGGWNTAFSSSANYTSYSNIVPVGVAGYYGGGGGSSANNTGSIVAGGTFAAAAGFLAGANGGSGAGTPGTAPAGGGASTGSTTNPSGAGAAGQVRITTYF